MAVYGLHWSKYVSSLHTRKMEKYSGIFGKDYSNKNRKCNEAWRHSRDLSTTSSERRAAIVSNEYLDIDDHHSLLGVGVLAASLKVATTAL